MGSPISHSKSPQIHQAFAAQFDIRLYYERVEVYPGSLAGALVEFVQGGGAGMNVTVPLKGEAFALATRCSEDVELARAANTLSLTPGGDIVADNTDGIGLIRDLVDNLGVGIRGRKVLLVGAGGAACGVASRLLGAEPRALTVVNRTVAKARELAARLADLGPVTACGFDELRGGVFDLIVNATSTGLTGGIVPLPDTAVAGTTVVYDMVYAAEPTPFLAWALARGARQAADGLGMLVEQAAESFYIWHGVKPATRPVIDDLRLRW